MSPSASKMLGDDQDEPLFQIGDDRPRKRAARKPGIRSYSGKAVTCHPCILAVERGDDLPFPRTKASWSVLTEAYREVLICDGHKALLDAGELKL